MRNKKILFFSLVGISIFCVGFMFFSIMTKTENDNNKSSLQDISKEIISIKDKHCDDGYCIKDFKINKLNNGTYEIYYLFLNTNDVPMEKGCVKLYFSEEDNYVSCYELVEAGAYVKQSISMEDDIYSKYQDYKIINLSGSELENNYQIYSEKR